MHWTKAGRDIKDKVSPQPHNHHSDMEVQMTNRYRSFVCLKLSWPAQVVKSAKLNRLLLYVLLTSTCLSVEIMLLTWLSVTESRRFAAAN